MTCIGLRSPSGRFAGSPAPVFAVDLPGVLVGGLVRAGSIAAPLRIAAREPTAG